jgi:hypothetical protein
MSLDDYTDPVFLTDQAKDLNDRFYLLLNNLVASYPDAKLNPSVTSAIDNKQTNQQVYNSNMGEMIKLQNDYFMYKNTIVKSSQDLMTFVNSVDDQINVLDAENMNLKKQLDEMANSTNSAEGMLDDSQLTRNQIFYGNIILLIIMVGGGYMYYKKVISSSAV